MLTYTLPVPPTAVWEHIWSPFRCWRRYCYNRATGAVSPIREWSGWGASQQIQCTACSVDSQNHRMV